jgi:hypothetical protein
MSWKFWKKDDLALPELSSSFGKESSFGRETAGMDLSTHFDASNQSFAPPPPQNSIPSSFSGYNPQFTQPAAPAPGIPVHDDRDISKDLEVIAAKLDTIRAQLEMLNTRVGHLEQSANQAQPKRPWY